MARVMFDSVDPTQIPADARMVAGYVDGRYKTVAALRRRFPHAQVVTITVTGEDADAHVCDTEPGNVGVEGAVGWARRRVKRHGVATIYCMRSQWDEVRRQVRRAGLAGKVHYWVADYTGKPHRLRGAVAVQHSAPGHGSAGHYDVSLVRRHWPGVDPPRSAGFSGPVLEALRILIHALLTRRRPLTKRARRRLAELEAAVREAKRR